MLENQRIWQILLVEHLLLEENWAKHFTYSISFNLYSYTDVDGEKTRFKLSYTGARGHTAPKLNKNAIMTA